MKLSAIIITELGILAVLIFVLIYSLAAGSLEYTTPVIIFIIITVALILFEFWLNRQGISINYRSYWDWGDNLSDWAHLPPQLPVLPQKIELLTSVMLYDVTIFPPGKTVELMPGVYEFYQLRWPTTIFDDELWWEDETSNHGLPSAELNALIANGQARWIEGDE
ncbi:MAG: hypothetical protein WCT16_04505 [Candidatus Buchananbacteria bacterium]